MYGVSIVDQEAVPQTKVEDDDDGIGREPDREVKAEQATVSSTSSYSSKVNCTEVCFIHGSV